MKEARDRLAIERDYISSLQKIHYTAEAERLNIPINIKQKKPIIVRDSESSIGENQLDWSFAREGYELTPTPSNFQWRPNGTNHNPAQNSINAQRRINAKRLKRCPATITLADSSSTSSYSDTLAGPTFCRRWDEGTMPNDWPQRNWSKPTEDQREQKRVLWADELEDGELSED